MKPQRIGFLTLQVLLILTMSFSGQISANAETTEHNSTDGNSAHSRNSFIIAPWYKGEVSLCYGTSAKEQGRDVYLQRVSVGSVHGLALNDFIELYIGADLDFYTHYYKDKEPYKSANLSGFRMSMKEFVDARGRYPFNDSFAVILDLGLGLSHGLLHYTTKPAFFCQFGPGIEWGHFTFYTGLQCFSGVNTYFARVAVNFY